jgi:hypothetical protein
MGSWRQGMSTPTIRRRQAASIDRREVQHGSP